MKTLQKLSLYREAVRCWVGRDSLRAFNPHSQPLPEQYGLTTEADRFMAKSVLDDLRQQMEGAPGKGV